MYPNNEKTKHMIPNFYKLFGLADYKHFNLTEKELFEKYVATINIFNKTNITSKFETGMYILKSPEIKKKYDYILSCGWTSIFINPLKLLYVLYIIDIVRIRSFFYYLISEVFTLFQNEF
jgi:hypothetical protein